MLSFHIYPSSMHEMSPMADKISSLPNTLIYHVLSFLPTKEAAATSVLSKKWRPMWLSVSTLHFDDQTYSENEETYFRFLELVYTVMLLRDVSQPIQMFNLECRSSLCDPCAINTWVTTAIQRKVQHLSLSLPCSTIHLPCCILTCTTLAVLKLKSLTVNNVHSVDFPLLKTLHLIRVCFVKNEYLFQILSGCPLLEDLLLSSLEMQISTYSKLFGPLKIKLPKLIRADVHDSGMVNIPAATFHNVQFLRSQVVPIIFFHHSSHTNFLYLTYMELFFDFNQ
ncbi:hypothetical protein VNO78_16026 [Psophocarpus tetragonolobus]|uniref:F-box domain-containing protein n=1 Tax=Psophocarpus tetragonolobus TaxID=3891 RepID=A0AAN9SG26_PSOTE